jgi:CheY-like chemotaxis protein
MKNIVVVDDQQMLLSIYRAKFVAEGFHVDVAADGEQALEVINRTKPDVILLDLMLPKIKGINVLKQVRANPLFKTLPIVVFSNSGQPGAVEEAWAAGASMVLSRSNTSPKQMVDSVLNALAISGPAEKNAASVSDFVPAKNGKTRALNGSGKGRILLVEINAEARAVLTLVLTQGGYQVSHADGQSHALLLVEVAHFDLVLINHALCLDSCASACQQMRRRHFRMPVVMYSANGRATEAKEALAAGVSRFLTRPEELLDVAEISAGLIEEARVAA